jgi:hypothetical protein
VLPDSGSKFLALKHMPIEANRKPSGLDLDIGTVAKGLDHFELVERLTGTELRPIQNFGAPDVSGI